MDAWAPCPLGLCAVRVILQKPVLEGALIFCWRQLHCCFCFSFWLSKTSKPTPKRCKVVMETKKHQSDAKWLQKHVKCPLSYTKQPQRHAKQSQIDGNRNTKWQQTQVRQMMIKRCKTATKRCRPTSKRHKKSTNRCKAKQQQWKKENDTKVMLLIR